MPKVKISTAVAHLKLDREAIEAAANDLEIEKDIILAADHKMHRLGVQQFVVDYDLHVIKLNPYQTKEQFTTTIWHELAHAMQAERHARLNGVGIEHFNRLYGDANGNYYTNPYEIEARKISIDNGNRKLVK